MALIILGGTLIDGSGASPINIFALVIDGEKITRVISDSNKIPCPNREDTVIEAYGKWIIPGMINCHDHIFLKSLKRAKLSGADGLLIEDLMKLPEAKLGFLCLSNGYEELRQGVTTIRDMGSPFGIANLVRDSIRDGWVDGPTILSSGQPISTIGGHFTPVSKGVKGELAIAEAVEEQIRNGVDFIKVMASGGLSNYPKEIPGKVELSKSELTAAVQAAHEKGFLVASHAQSEQSTINSIDAGTDSIEHGFVLNESIVDKMTKKSISYVPTTCVLPNVLERSIRNSNKMMTKLIEGELLSKHRDSLLLSYNKRVLIGAGTDSSGTMPQEVKMLVEWGMSNMDALMAATSNAAIISGIEDSVGVIKEDMIADLIILDGNPLDYISAIDLVKGVISRGKIVNI